MTMNPRESAKPADTKVLGGSEGEDCGWVDYVQWSGVLDNPLPTDWTTISYTYDPFGRRIAKSYDGTVVARYLYDGPHIIAEYDGNNRLLRKYLHGPGEGVSPRISVLTYSG
jgi:hypothetical protein